MTERGLSYAWNLATLRLRFQRQIVPKTGKGFAINNIAGQNPATVVSGLKIVERVFSNMQIGS